MQMIPPSRSAAVPVFLLAISILLAGCTAQQDSGGIPTLPDKGVTETTPHAKAVPCNLSQADAGFREWARVRFSPSEDEDRTLPGNMSLAELPLNVSSSLEIHFIRAPDLSAEGTAGNWLFGIRAGNAPFLAEYQDAAWTLRELPGTLPAGTLNVSDVIQPAGLLERYPVVKKEIFSADTNGADLLLEAKTYTLSSKSGTVYRAWRFDAENGSVIDLP